jgi:hypothetical protein
VQVQDKSASTNVREAALRSTRTLDLNRRTVPYKSKVVLHCLSQAPPGLEDLVETFLRDGVKFVGVVGVGASHVEDIIDEIVVGDGSNPDRFILTSSHEHESLEEALEFANALTGEFAGDVQVVEV